MSIDTKAYKRVLPPHLAKMPGEWVTQNIADDKRMHPHDPPHIIKHLAKARLGEWAAHARKEEPLKLAEIIVSAHFNALRKTPERYKVINQELVDLYRAVVIIARAKRVARGGTNAEHANKLAHIWFDDPTLGTMLNLRPGAEPPDIDRPEFLKNLKLTVDLFDWPARMRDMLKAAGIDAQELIDATKVKFAAVAYVAAVH